MDIMNKNEREVLKSVINKHQNNLEIENKITRNYFK